MANFGLYAIDGENAMPLSRHTLITFFLLLTTSGLSAAEVHQHAHDHAEDLMQMHGSHVHGEVVVNMVLEGERLDVEMISPAMNITGYEHAPSTEQERQALAEAIDKLGVASNLLTLPAAAGCEPGDSTVETSLTKEHADHDHKHTGEHEEDHAEFHVTHAFRCEKPGAIDSVTLTLLSDFPGVEKARLQWIHGQLQGAAVLEPVNPVVRFD